MTPIPSNPSEPLTTQLINGAYTGCQKTYDVTKKIAAFAAPYLTLGFLKQKTKNAIQAKALPLSAPPGWAEEMNKTKQQVMHYKALKPGLESELAGKKAKIEQLEQLQTTAPQAFYGSHHEKDLTVLQADSQTIKERLQTLTRNLDTAQIKISHLNVLRGTQIVGQLAGWTGNVCNLIIPGSGLGVSLAMVTWATSMREKDAQKICDIAEDKEFAASTQRKIRIGTLLTATSTIASTALMILCKPILVEGLKNVQTVAEQHFNN